MLGKSARLPAPGVYSILLFQPNEEEWKRGIRSCQGPKARTFGAHTSGIYGLAQKQRFLALSMLKRQLFAAGISAREDFLEAQSPNSHLLQLVPV